MGFVLVGAGVSLIVLGWRSGSAAVTGGVQASVAAVLAVVVAGVVARTASDAVEATAFALVAGTSVALGLIFGLAGRLRLANLIRFVPFPVVGGFLAGTGWLLIKGAVDVMIGRPLDLAHIGDVLTSDSLRHLLPGLALAVALVAAQRMVRRSWVLPVLLTSALVLFWVITLTSASGDMAREGGWLLGPFPTSPRWIPIGPSDLLDADWGAIVGEVGGLLTIVVLAFVGLLFNATSLEVINHEDLDLDGELRAAGFANVVTGFAGGPPGYHSVTLTLMARSLGAPNRAAAYLAGAICVLLGFTGGGLIESVPRFLLGGLIASFGIALLFEWLVAFRHRLPPAEYGVVVAIVIVIAAFGFLEGVGFGIALAAGLFAFTYSRYDTVKHRLTGAEYSSKVNRAPRHAQQLHALGDHVDILELQGFLFFGSVHKVIESIAERAAATDVRALRFVVVDFRRIRGIDSSGVLGFTKLARLADQHGFVVVMTGVASEIGSQLEVGGFDASLPNVEFFRDLDHGLEFCEDALLDAADAGREHTEDVQQLLQSLLHEDQGGDRLRQYVETIQVPSGDAVIRQGDAASDLFIVVSGTLTTLLDVDGEPAVRLARVGAGSVVGEIGLYTGETRSASVVAEEDCVVERLSADAVARMERDDPDLAMALHRSMVRLVSDRLARANEAVRALID
jgi:SulP family sulfate permease